ncbi:MAG: DUF29 domain-containing protein [Phormidium sp. GEM2.Bin31]|nr:MAG: DUF29 domain-containing protein [Phormidium sp. GEM2.Bin31]UCJ13536.1 MAG: DUF29 family protein [Phormidium sp. PBR-2020]
MLARSTPISPNLYESDYHLWLLETRQKLETQDFNALDLENLIEEITDLARRDKRAIKNLLKHLVEHLLKLKYWKAERERNQGHWQREILNFRQQIQDYLKESPSLKPYFQEIYHPCYRDGRQLAANVSQLPLNTFPEEPITNLETLLNPDWLP